MRTPRIKMSAEKNYFAINFIHLIHIVCQVLSTFTSVIVSSQSPLTSSWNLLLTFASFLLPFHNIPPSVSSIALDVQHFLKPFTITSGEKCSHAVMIHTDYIIHFYFLFCKLMAYPWRRCTVFSIDDVSGVWISNTCVLDFCVVSVLWSVWSHDGFFDIQFVNLFRFYFWV